MVPVKLDQALLVRPPTLSAPGKLDPTLSGPTLGEDPSKMGRPKVDPTLGEDPPRGSDPTGSDPFPVSGVL